MESFLGVSGGFPLLSPSHPPGDAVGSGAGPVEPKSHCDAGGGVGAPVRHRPVKSTREQACDRRGCPLVRVPDLAV